MTLQEEIPQQNPFEDQRKQALELYEKMVKECHHCSSFIQKAIESYNPDLKAQLSAKDKENERLTKENEYHRSENHPLRISNAAYASACDGFQKENQELRKRCEDLEALNYEFQDTLKSILDTSEMVPSIKEEAEKLLNGNQIKS